MKPENMLADISRRFFNKNQIHKYRMKKITDMSDSECIDSCHWFCEEHELVYQFETFRTEIESHFRFCTYLQEYIEDGLCVDIQMIFNGYIKHTALPEYSVDTESSLKKCFDCKYKIKI